MSWSKRVLFLKKAFNILAFLTYDYIEKLIISRIFLICSKGRENCRKLDEIVKEKEFGKKSENVLLNYKHKKSFPPRRRKAFSMSLSDYFE